MIFRVAIVAAFAGIFALAQTDRARAVYGGAAETASRDGSVPFGAASDLMSRLTPDIPHTVAQPASRLPDQARKDVGCIGYHGVASGHSRHGKCVTKKKS